MDCVRERVLTNPLVELEGTESGAWVEIDREAISRNLQSVLSVLGSETQPCAVVKGNADGHGIEHVLPILQAQGIKIIGIADNLNARRVRSLGFDGRLLRVRTATAQEVIAAAGLGIEEMIGGLGGRGECLVRGHRARVLGKISMNTLVVNVTEIPDVGPGDEVVLIGRQGMEEITAADVELTSETPVLELCTM